MVVQLPDTGVFLLPRQRPVPKVKAKTRWQKFMEEKNMQKRKRSKMVWDEVSGDWKPRWGYKSAKKSEEHAKDWMIEVKPGDDPSENPFEKKRAEKKLLQAKQKMREVRNKVEALGGKLKASTPDLAKGGAKRGKDGLREAVKRAQASSASMGKFDRVAPNEATNLQPKKRKGLGTYSPGDEKERYMKAATRILSGEGGVDSAKAARIGVSQDKRGGAAGRAKGEGKGGGQGKRRSKQGGKKKR